MLVMLFQLIRLNIELQQARIYTILIEIVVTNLFS